MPDEARGERRERREKDAGELRLLLVNAIDPRSDQFIYPTNMSQGLLSLHAAVTAALPGARTRLLSWDALGEEDPSRRFAGILDAFRPDVVGVSAYSNMMPLATRIAEQARAALPSATTLLGGIHATSFPEGLSRHPAFDYYVRGEGVRVLPALLRHLRDGSPRLDEIPSLAYRRDGETVLTPLEEPPEEMDLNPPIDWSLLAVDPRPEPGIIRLDEFTCLDVGPGTMAPYESSQGCNQHCRFCERISGTRFRSFSAARVASDVASMAREADVRWVFFADEHVHRRRSHFEALLSELAKIRSLGVRYYFAVRADEVDPPLIDRMIDAGAAFLHVFPESGSARIRGLMGKNLDVEKGLRHTAYASERGLFVFGGYMAGWPGETREELEASLEQARDPMFDFLYLPFLWCLARSELKVHLEAAGIVADTPGYFDYLAGGRRLHLAAWPEGEAGRISEERLRINREKAASPATRAKLEALGCRLLERPLRPRGGARDRR